MLQSLVRGWEKMARGNIRLVAITPVKPLVAGDLALLVPSRNERRFIDPFLRHYRQLGITRFIWIDDRSTDGSVEALKEQRDVDLYVSNARYKEARRGRLWRHMLVDLYGQNRWYLSVDVDAS
jgi:hypothetical protein